MKKMFGLFRDAHAKILCLGIALLGAGVKSPAENAGKLSVHPVRDDAFLLNPGKGFVQYWEPDATIFYKYREPDDKYVRDYISVGYTRLNWSMLEPKEGSFDWRIIDRFIAEYARYGKKVGLGVMSVTTGQREQYVTPKWVFDAGAVPLSIPDNTTPTGTQIIPMTWDDPVFLAKMKNFIAAFGKRYDGDPNIAFIDMRNFGNWGEGHIGGLGGDPRIVLATPKTLQNDYYLPYMKAFPKTQLISVWGNSVYEKVYDWAVDHGVGIRRDGILSQWSKDGSECLRAHGREPAIFEYCDTYDNTRRDGYWSTDSLLRYIESGKPSYLQWERKIFEENKDFCLMLGNKVGYHFILEEAEIPESLTPDVPFQIKLRWLNDGVAYLYEPCSVAIALLDGNSRVVRQQWLKGSSPGKWAPGETTAETFKTTFAPPIDPGVYKLVIGMFLDKNDAEPAYKLGIKNRTESGWYVLDDNVKVNPAIDSK